MKSDPVRELLKDYAFRPRPWEISPQKATKAEDYCCRCGHVHQGVGECGENMGGGGFCRCQMEGVPR